jgi:hypothetical protein
MQNFKSYVILCVEIKKKLITTILSVLRTKATVSRCPVLKIDLPLALFWSGSGSQPTISKQIAENKAN